jgi:putative transcriptional regulator
MTQLELAEKAGASRQTIIALESGKYLPSLELAFKIANAFKIPIGEVFECKVQEENHAGLLNR